MKTNMSSLSHELTPVEGVRAVAGSMSRLPSTARVGVGVLAAGIIASGNQQWAAELLRNNGCRRANAICGTVRQLIRVDASPPG